MHYALPKSTLQPQKVQLQSTVGHATGFLDTEYCTARKIVHLTGKFMQAHFMISFKRYTDTECQIYLKSL